MSLALGRRCVLVVTLLGAACSNPAGRQPVDVPGTQQLPPAPPPLAPPDSAGSTPPVGIDPGVVPPDQNATLPDAADAADAAARNDTPDTKVPSPSPSAAATTPTTTATTPPSTGTTKPTGSDTLSNDETQVHLKDIATWNQTTDLAPADVKWQLLDVN